MGSWRAGQSRQKPNNQEDDEDYGRIVRPFYTYPYTVDIDFSDWSRGVIGVDHSKPQNHPYELPTIIIQVEDPLNMEGQSRCFARMDDANDRAEAARPRRNLPRRRREPRGHEILKAEHAKPDWYSFRFAPQFNPKGVELQAQENLRKELSESPDSTADADRDLHPCLKFIPHMEFDKLPIAKPEFVSTLTQAVQANQNKFSARPKPSSTNRVLEGKPRVKFADVPERRCHNAGPSDIWKAGRPAIRVGSPYPDR